MVSRKTNYNILGRFMREVEKRGEEKYCFQIFLSVNTTKIQ